MKRIFLTLTMCFLWASATLADAYLTVLGEDVDISDLFNQHDKIAANRLSQGKISYDPSNRMLIFDNVISTSNNVEKVIGCNYEGLTIKFIGNNKFNNGVLLYTFSSVNITGDGASSSSINLTRGDDNFGCSTIYSVSNDNPISINISDVTLNLTDNRHTLGIISNIGSSWNEASLTFKRVAAHLVSDYSSPYSVIRGFTKFEYSGCTPNESGITYNTTKQGLVHSDGSFVKELVMTTAYVSVNGTVINDDNKHEGGTVAGVSYDNGVLTLNKINRTVGLTIRTNIDGLKVRLVGDNVIKHGYSTNSSFLMIEEGGSVTIDGENSGTLTIEHTTQGNYPMFNMYKNTSVTIKDVPAINITCGHSVMYGSINSGGTAKLTINNSTGKFVSTKQTNPIIGIASLTLVGTELVAGNDASRTPYTSGTRFEFKATGTNVLDVNGDGNVNVADVNYVLKLIMNEQYESKADVNADNAVNVADVNVILNYILATS